MEELPKYRGEVWAGLQGAGGREGKGELPAAATRNAHTLQPIFSSLKKVKARTETTILRVERAMKLSSRMRANAGHSLVQLLAKLPCRIVPDSLLAVQRSHPCSYHQGEQVSLRRTILVRTSQLRLCLRKSMRDKAWEGWLHRCSCREEKQVQPFQKISLYCILTQRCLRLHDTPAGSLSVLPA